MSMDTLSFVADDRNLITYRPAWNAFTGGVNATILLQQMIFYWQSNGQKPFYKFKQPCSHRLYRTGDSWTEKLGMTPKEFDTALGKLKAKGLVSSSIDISRVTQYTLHEDLVKQMFEAVYTSKNSHTQKGIYVNDDCSVTNTQKGVYINDDSTVTYPTNQDLLDDKSAVIYPTNQDLDIQRLTTEITTENSSKKKEGSNFFKNEMVEKMQRESPVPPVRQPSIRGLLMPVNEQASIHALAKLTASQQRIYRQLRGWCVDIAPNSEAILALAADAALERKTMVELQHLKTNGPFIRAMWYSLEQLGLVFGSAA